MGFVSFGLIMRSISPRAELGACLYSIDIDSSFVSYHSKRLEPKGKPGTTNG